MEGKGEEKRERGRGGKGGREEQATAITQGVGALCPGQRHPGVLSPSSLPLRPPTPVYRAAPCSSPELAEPQRHLLINCTN